MNLKTTLVLSVAFGMAGATLANTLDRGQTNGEAVHGQFGALRTGANVLVVNDYLPWGGDVLPTFLAHDCNVTVIGSADIAATDLSAYCLLYLTAGTTTPGDPTANNLQNAMAQVEEYVVAGGELLFFTGTWGAMYTAPGGLTTDLLEDELNLFPEPHPMDAGMPNPFAGEWASHDIFGNLPVGSTVITTTPTGATTGVEYPLGAGHCVVMSQPIECYLIGGVCHPDGYTHMETLFDNAVTYALANADCGGGAVEAVDQPASFALRGNFPNPFNPTTTIAFSVAATAQVELGVWNLAGERVATLVDGIVAGGAHEVVFDAAALPSGVYVSRLQVGDEVAAARMLLVK